MTQGPVMICSAAAEAGHVSAAEALREAFAMRRAARAVGRPNAAAEIVSEVLSR